MSYYAHSMDDLATFDDMLPSFATNSKKYKKTKLTEGVFSKGVDDLTIQVPYKVSERQRCGTIKAKKFGIAYDQHEIHDFSDRFLGMWFCSP